VAGFGAENGFREMRLYGRHERRLSKEVNAPEARSGCQNGFLGLQGLLGLQNKIG
jgi:hypothetical protein